MADDKVKTSTEDRLRVARGEDDDVRYFAHEHDLTIAEAAETLAPVGNDRAKLGDAAAPIRKR